VAGLGEFSPIGRLFTLGRFLKITKVAQIFGQFLHGTSELLILAKTGWAVLWAIFSQTLLVTMETIKLKQFMLFASPVRKTNGHSR
jgi:hypothetical protein